MSDKEPKTLTDEEINAEIAKRETKAEKMTFKDETEKSLYTRYGMDSKIWQKSQRNYFPYNAPLELIAGVPLVLPIVVLIYNLSVDKDWEYLKTILQTLGVSLAGFHISDKLIDAFKDSLRNKGLFGRDLNKAGVQKNKKPV